MKLTLIEPKYLKESIGIISELVNDVNIKINKTGIELVAIDPANVSMVIFRLLSSAFVTYELDSDKIIGINLEHFKQILKRVKQTDIMTLELDENKNKLNILLQGDTKRSFTLSLIDIDNSEQKIPNLDFTVKVETNSNLFNEAIEDIDVIAESLSLSVDNNVFLIKGEGNLSHGLIELRPENETEIINNKGENIKAKYSIEYLKKIIKGGRLSNKVSLQFAQDYPLKIEYKVIDKMNMTFILAPRVAND
ncbi:proliferating cell nuclear antigen (pcna) [Candidatus Woesearchaeota archaeon]|nr:proliferating cell nuclear antigen (pcna) [Candidatus Woesearchaeota archaeon]